MLVFYTDKSILLYNTLAYIHTTTLGIAKETRKFNDCVQENDNTRMAHYGMKDKNPLLYVKFIICNKKTLHNCLNYWTTMSTIKQLIIDRVQRYKSTFKDFFVSIR